MENVTMDSKGPPVAAINILPQAHVPKPADESLEETVRKFIKEFCSGQDCALKASVSVKEMRHVVPTLMLLLYANRHDQSQRKVKGIWNKKPLNWPEEVPFADPNNKKDRNKPRKEALQLMTRFLLQEYAKHEDGGLPTQEVGPDHSIPGARRSPSRQSMLPRPILQRVVSEEGWRPAEEIIERCQKKIAVVKLEPHHHNVVQLAITLLEDQAPIAYDGNIFSAYVTLSHELERALDLALVLKTLPPDAEMKLRSGLADFHGILSPNKEIKSDIDEAPHGDVTKELDNLKIQSPHRSSEEPRVSVVQPSSDSAVTYYSSAGYYSMSTNDTVNLNSMPGSDESRVTYLAPESAQGYKVAYFLPEGYPASPYPYHVEDQPQEVVTQEPENKTFTDLSNVQQSAMDLNQDGRFIMPGTDGALEPAEVMIDSGEGVTSVETNVALEAQQVPIKTETSFPAAPDMPVKPIAGAVLQVGMVTYQPADQILPGAFKAVGDGLSTMQFQAIGDQEGVEGDKIYEIMDVVEEVVVDNANLIPSPTASPTPFIPTVVTKLDGVPSYHTTLSDSMKPPRKRKRHDMKYM